MELKSDDDCVVDYVPVQSGCVELMMGREDTSFLRGGCEQGSAW